MLGKITVTHHLLLSEWRDPTLSESNGEELLVKVPAGNWADHVEYAEGLAELELEPSQSTSSCSLTWPLTIMKITCWTTAWMCTVYWKMNKRLCCQASMPPLLHQSARTIQPSPHCASHCTVVHLMNWSWSGPLLHQLCHSAWLLTVFGSGWSL